MTFWIDPTIDPRWEVFVMQHPRATVFHTPGWIRALARTYGFTPLALTTAAANETITEGMPFCLVSSWLTGRRLISLPFSDHCEPLVSGTAGGVALFESFQDRVEDLGVRKSEIRPLSESLVDYGLSGFQTTERFCLHTLDLTPASEQLMSAFHRDCVQRKIRRAERDQVSCESGRSESLVRTFYALNLLTRRKHRLLPQPLAWFRNLVECLGDALTISIARLDGRPIAGIMTIRHNRTLVYKYGCSDSRFNHHGATPLLFWKTIQEAKSSGCTVLDLGRSGMKDEGLIAFKDRWNATRSALCYVGYPPRAAVGGLKDRLLGWGGIVENMPDRLLSAMGGLLYRHFA